MNYEPLRPRAVPCVKDAKHISLGRSP